MEVKKWLNEVAYVDREVCMDKGFNKTYSPYRYKYVSKIDGSIIASVGAEESWLPKFLAEHEVTNDVSKGVGYSPKENMWYGWNRSVAKGFAVGDKCSKGDSGYTASNLQDQLYEVIEFWTSEFIVNVRSKGIIEYNGDKCFDLVWDYVDEDDTSCAYSTSGVNQPILPLGRGEWTALNIKDAMVMALEFGKGSSARGSTC